MERGCISDYVPLHATFMVHCLCYNTTRQDTPSHPLTEITLLDLELAIIALLVKDTNGNILVLVGACSDVSEGGVATRHPGVRLQVLQYRLAHLKVMGITRGLNTTKGQGETHILCRNK